MQVREVEELRAQAAQLRGTQAELDRAREELRQHKEVPTPEPMLARGPFSGFVGIATTGDTIQTLAVAEAVLQPLSAVSKYFLDTLFARPSVHLDFGSRKRGWEKRSQCCARTRTWSSVW